MNTVKIKAYAKVNLTLDITGVSQGWHLLDSFVASVDLFDLVCVKKRKDKLVSVTMHGMDSEGILPENNNALKAGEAFVRRFDTCGADITVYKNIPIGAGLGGSSADAAGTLNGMAKLYGITDEQLLGELADGLGSDTRYMLRGGFCRMRGRGNELQPIKNVKTRLYFLLICPRTSVSSGACYREYDRAPAALSSTRECIDAFVGKDLQRMGRYLTNALYPAAARLNGDVKKALEEAESFSPLGAAMTGSGSGVLAMFETRELCEWAKSRYRGKFRVYTVQTADPSEKKKFFRSPFVLTDGE